MGRVVIAAFLLSLFPTVSSAQPPPPRDAEVTEQVEVRLVLVDTLVVDRAGRAVADLTKDDFELFVDYDPRPIDTLDLSCTSGTAEDPEAVARLGDVRPAVAPAAARRIVLAVDYMHLGQIERVDVITRMRDMIAGADPAAEEVMIAAITGDLRVEQIFSGDRRQALDTLERMENDISLWLPAFDHLHELRFFRSLDQLVDLLGLVSGSKAVVLFSNLPGPSASYDVAFERIASKATHARVAFYPVLARGLSVVSAPRLARLAVETGGRFTENTNDLSLGYARAQRDLTCRYVLGFYDENPGRGKARRVSVRVRRRGVRAVHPASYEFPKPDEERASRLQSALIAPEMFEDAAISAHFFPVRPHGSKRWEGLLAIGFPIDGNAWDGGDAVRDVAAVLKRGSHVAEAFTRRVALRSTGDRAKREGPVRATYLTPVVARPGDHTLAAAVSDPGSTLPLAAGVSFSLPPVPPDSLFVVPPILGRRPAGDFEFREIAEDLPADFEPLLESHLALGQPAAIMTHVCSNSVADAFVERALRSADGKVLLSLPQATPVWPKASRVKCAGVVDDLPTASLAAGDYRFEVAVTQGALRAVESVAFSIGSPE